MAHKTAQTKAARRAKVLEHFDERFLTGTNAFVLQNPPSEQSPPHLAWPVPLFGSQGGFSPGSWASGRLS